MTAPQLPGAAGRGRTYAFMAGVVATSLTLAVGLPLVLADRPQEQLATAPTGGDVFAVPSGAPGLTAAEPGAPLPTDLPAGLPVPPLGGVVAGQPLPEEGAAAPLPGAPLPAGPAPDGAGRGPAAPVEGAGRAPAVADEPRRASDQGVTPSTVKLGVFIIDFGRANDVGASVTGYSPAQQRRLAQAFADEINSKGGARGRKVVLAFRTVDILDQQSMRDACADFAETDRVFAVTQNLGVYGDPLLKCTRDLRLPMLQNDSAVSQYYPASRGYLFTTQPSTLRTQVNMVRQLVRLGELKGKKVGFLYEDGYLLRDNELTIAELKRHGIDPVRGVTSASDVALALRQIPPIAQDMCSKKVDFVLYAVNSIYGSQFSQNMTRFGCRPAYAVSDFDFTMNGDSFPQDMPDAWFDRALSITSSRTGEGRVGRPEPGHDAACRRVAEKRLGSKLDRNKATDSNYSAVVNACTLQSLFVKGLEAAGPNPTRASFVAALGRIGRFENGGYGPSTFRPGKLDAPDAVRVTRGFLDCKCWRPQTDFFAPT